MSATPITTTVMIVGGGPAGLCLSIELGMRGVPCVLLDDKDDTTRHPQANATQARTMEHYRRMGFAAEIRAAGLPPDYPTDIAYFTRYSRHELARFSMPASADVRGMARRASGSWSTPELPHRCSQMYIERVLRKHAETFPGNRLRYGWRVTGFRESGERVTVSAESVTGGQPVTIACDYLVGCDGSRSVVRESLGIRYRGEGAASRDFMGGTMCAVYFRCPELYRLISGDRAWMYWTFNRDRRALMAALNGVDEFVFHTQLRGRELGETVSDARARELFEQALGGACPIEVLSSAMWNAGYTLVAESYGQGRVFLAGDAAHLFTPTGGLGYNTAVDDVVNLGWKLAAVVHGWGGSRLLQSYVAERLPIGHRNTRLARTFADSVGNLTADPALEDDSPAGERARATASRYLFDHARREFNIPGATFGVRYDGSPIIRADATPPADTINEYQPSGIPGGRAPHVWLGEDSLYDRLGREFTLLRLAPDADPRAWVRTARARDVPLTVLDVSAAGSEARDLYGADLALIRPDQYVAWRGTDAVDPGGVFWRVLGSDEL